jgi:hypothetical protein
MLDSYPKSFGFSQNLRAFLKPKMFRKPIPSRIALSFVLLALGSLPASAADTFNVTSTPALFPAFNPAVTDYVVQIPSGNTINVTIQVPPDAQATLDGTSYAGGDSGTAIHVNPGQSFSFVLTPANGDPATYYVRCLPKDFPYWAATKAGAPQTEWYVVSPSFSVSSNTLRQYYVIVFDNDGVPVWWRHNPAVP